MVKLIIPGSDSSYIVGSCIHRRQAITSMAYNLQPLALMRALTSYSSESA